MTTPSTQAAAPAPSALDAVRESVRLETSDGAFVTRVLVPRGLRPDVINWGVRTFTFHRMTGDSPTYREGFAWAAVRWPDQLSAAGPAPSMWQSPTGDQ